MHLDIGEDSVKFALICGLVSVEFDEPALKDLDEVADYGIVGLLLLASGKP
jgi:hypothetical protein